MDPLKLTLLIGGGLTLWVTLLCLGLYGASRVARPGLRAMVKATVVALFCGIGPIGGHGCAPAPVVVVLFVPGHFWMGVVALVFNWIPWAAFFFFREQKTVP